MDNLKQKLKINDPKFDALTNDDAQYKLPIELAKWTTRQRILKDWSQHKLAVKMNTKQTGISRLESGRSLPSLSFLQKLVDTLEVPLEIKVEPRTYLKTI